MRVLMVHRGSMIFGLALGAWALACSLTATPARGQQSLELSRGGAREAAEITFLGYRALPNAGGVIFVEMTKPVEVEVTQRDNVIEYRLVGARVPLANNKNPLLLRDFGSSALKAVLVPEKKRGRAAPAVRLVITLRAKVAPTHRVLARGQGAALEVELPPPP